MNPYLLINIKVIYWPTMPNNNDSAIVLMNKLSHRSKVICALEAAKMVISIWEEYLFDKTFSKEQKEAPKKVIEIIERWLDGKASVNEVKEAASLATIVKFTTSAPPIAHAVVQAVIYAAITAYDSNYASHSAIYAAAYAATTTTTSDSGHTVNEWWERCYSLVGQELQNKYDLLCKNINGDL